MSPNSVVMSIPKALLAGAAPAHFGVALQETAQHERPLPPDLAAVDQRHRRDVTFGRLVYPVANISSTVTSVVGERTSRSTSSSLSSVLWRVGELARTTRTDSSISIL